MTLRKGQLQHLHLETVKNRAMPIQPKKSYKKRTIRLPAELMDLVDAEGDRNGRSFNAELTAKLIEVYAFPTLASLNQRHDETQALVRKALEELEALKIRK